VIYESAFKTNAMVTMKKIAEMAKVSQSTVSRILNGTANATPEKKARVMEVVRKLDFKPNQAARALASNRSHLFGVIFPDLMTPFFMDVLTHVERISAKNGYNIIICNSSGNEQKEREALASLRSRQVDGVLVGLTSSRSPLLEQLRKQTLKSVVITQEHSGIDCVGTSHPHGGMLAARHFLEQGVEEFAFLGPEGDEKFFGYQKALLQAGVKPGHIHVIAVEHWLLRIVDQGYKAMTSFLSKWEQDTRIKTGVFAVNDSFGLSAIHAAQDLGVRIPDQLSIVGFDNTYLCTNVKPMLSSIAQPTEEIGRLGVELLLKRIENAEPLAEAVHIQLEPQLIRRETS
jgi:LacI family transcriptional regulator